MTDIQRPASPRVHDFQVGDWLAEPALNRLTSSGAVVHVRPQLMDVLVCLARHQGRVVLKDELLGEVWPDRIITESGMVRCIAELRQLLGDDSHHPRYIETISKRGYRLLEAVTWLPAATASPADRASATAAPEASDPRSRGDATDAPPADETRPAFRFPRRWAVAGATALVVLALVLVALIARGRPAAALTEQDVIVLAFENTTGDRVFDDTLPMAMAIQFEQSPFLRLLSNERIRDILAQMKKPADAPVTKAVGLEVCERAGAAALIVGTVTPLGSRYVIGLQASSCASGDVLGREQIEVPSKDDVLGALGGAASRLRRALGESRESMARYDVPIAEGTTRSLDALRAMREGDAARDRGQLTEALERYRAAVRHDPEFALGQSRLATAAMNAHYEPEGLAALERAYAQRDRVTVPERLEIDLIYHVYTTGNQATITEIQQTLRREYPRRAVYRRRLASHSLDVGNFPEALAEALEAERLEPSSASTYFILARSYFALGRWADVRNTVEAAISRGLATESLRSMLMQVGFVTGDDALVAREREWAATRPEATPFFLEFEAENDVWHGRLARAVASLEAYQAWARQRGAEYRWTVLELRKARYEALCGQTSAARARMTRQLKSGRLDGGLKVDALKVAISAGDTATARTLIAEFDALGWPKVEQPFAGFVLAYRAAIDTHSGHADQALARLTPFVPFELGLDWGLIPLHERALAHLKAGQWQEARDAFQKMLDHPGVFSGQKLLPLAQIGLARALAAGGQRDLSRAAYDEFFRLWKDADADLPLLATARRERAALP